jgi:hypothetical protein
MRIHSTLRTLNWADIALHVAAALAMLAWPLMLGPWGLVPLVAEAWLLREAAQANSGNLIAAISSMPQWSLQKQMEWLAPTLAAAVAIAFWQVFS